MPDREPVWIRPPLIVRAPYLRWALYRGETLKGIRWSLREDWDDSRFHPLHLAEHPSTSELVEAMTPVVGRPIADILAELALEAVPEAIAN